MAILYMIMVTAFWGGSFLFIKVALQHMSATTFIFLRFVIAALSMLPSLILYRIPLKQQTIIQGAQLGLLQAGVLFLQTLGLKTISPALSAFLTGFSIVFVLFIRFIMRRILPSIIDLFSSLLCLAGLALLTHSYGLCWEPGVLYTLCCALFLALHTCVLGEYSPTSNTTLLTFMQMLTLITFAGVASWLADNSIQLPTHLASWGSILFCGILCTSVASWLKAYAQQHLESFQVAMILMLEPVFTTIFACGVLGEQLAIQACIGMAMIIGAITIINSRLKSIS